MCISKRDDVILIYLDIKIFSKTKSIRGAWWKPVWKIVAATDFPVWTCGNKGADCPGVGPGSFFQTDFIPNMKPDPFFVLIWADIIKNSTDFEY
jgi:hypothetical protein